MTDYSAAQGVTTAGNHALPGVRSVHLSTFA